MAIVAAVDRSDRAETAVREAETLANAFGDDVHVVHVLNRADFVNLGRTKAEEGDPVDMERVIEVAAGIAEEAADALDGPFEAVGLTGDPADCVVEYAEKVDARYVVVAGRKRSPVGKVLFGSVAQSILLNADCPVLMSVHHRPDE